MTVELQTRATEDSTYVVGATFKDEDGALVVPNTIMWSLQDDTTGDVVNSRSDVSVGTPASSIDILLQGADLEPLTSDRRKLVLTINATYDSILGTDLPLISQCWIIVEALEP